MSYIYCLALIDDSSSQLIHISYELSKFIFFERFTIKNICRFAVMESLRFYKTENKVQQFRIIEYEGYWCYLYLTVEGLVISCITKNEYPIETIYKLVIDSVLVYKIHHNDKTYLESSINKLLISYQDISYQVDPIIIYKNNIFNPKMIVSVQLKDEQVIEILKTTQYLNKNQKMMLLKLLKSLKPNDTNM